MSASKILTLPHSKRANSAEGQGYEAPAEPEPQYFETLAEAVEFEFKLVAGECDKAESENERLREALDRFAKAGVEFCQCGHINVEHYGAADWQSNLDCDYICGVKECECKKFSGEENA